MLSENYLKKRNKRVVLNGLSSSWKKILAGVPQVSVLGPLLYLITHLQSVKCLLMTLHFFSKVKDSSLFLSDLNCDLEIINQWAHQWKMLFNPDPNKQATEVLSSRKVNSDDHPKLTFNGNQVQKCSSQKHLGLFST